MRKALTIGFVFVGLLAGTANAYCAEPSLYMATPLKPNIPYYINEWNNTHTCDDWVIQNYYDDMNSYADEVETFMNALNNYVSEASEFARCKAGEIQQ